MRWITVLERIVARAEQIRGAAATANRNYTPDEVRELTALFAAGDVGADLLDARPGRRQTEPDEPGTMPGERPRTPRGAVAARERFVDVRTGEQLPVLAATDCLSDLAPYHGPELSLSGCMLGWLSGDWSRAGPPDVRAQMGETGDATGGFLMPQVLSNQIIDRARSASVLMAAGAKTITMTSKTLDVAKVLSDPEPVWRPEHYPIAESTPTLGLVTFTANLVGSIIRVSLELLEDAANSETLIRNLLATSLAREIDRVGLFGDGTSYEPLGAMNHPNVQSVAANGALTGYSAFLDAMEKVWSANGEVNAVIMSPAVRRRLAGLTEATTNAPLAAPADFAALPKFYTTKLSPNGSPPTYDAILGDFGQIYYGMRSGVRLELANAGGNYTSDSPPVSGDAFSRAQYRIRAIARLDVQLFHANHLCKVVGIE